MPNPRRQFFIVMAVLVIGLLVSLFIFSNRKSQSELMGVVEVKKAQPAQMTTSKSTNTTQTSAPTLLVTLAETNGYQHSAVNNQKITILNLRLTAQDGPVTITGFTYTGFLDASYNKTFKQGFDEGKYLKSALENLCFYDGKSEHCGYQIDNNGILAMTGFGSLKIDQDKSLVITLLGTAKSLNDGNPDRLAFNIASPDNIKTDGARVDNDSSSSTNWISPNGDLENTTTITSDQNQQTGDSSQNEPIPSETANPPILDIAYYNHVAYADAGKQSQLLTLNVQAFYSNVVVKKIIISTLHDMGDGKPHQGEDEGVNITKLITLPKLKYDNSWFSGVIDSQTGTITFDNVKIGLSKDLQKPLPIQLYATIVNPLPIKSQKIYFDLRRPEQVFPDPKNAIINDGDKTVTTDTWQSFNASLKYYTELKTATP